MDPYGALWSLSNPMEPYVRPTGPCEAVLSPMDPDGAFLIPHGTILPPAPMDPHVAENKLHNEAL